jgi:hypothetical protein
MAYTTLNIQIFTAAYCGALAGMGLSDFRRLASSWWATTIMQTRLSRVAEGESTLDSVTMADDDGTSGPAEVDLPRSSGHAP